MVLAGIHMQALHYIAQVVLMFPQYCNHINSLGPTKTA